MRYHVRAKFRNEKREEFLRVLTDGTVESIKPEGGEILACMRRAVLRSGRVEWSETCYCPTPLAHERSVVFDRFFTDIETDPLDAPAHPEGESFWKYLETGTEPREK